jgi:sensor domain CHASE-containing protein
MRSILRLFRRARTGSAMVLAKQENGNLSPHLNRSRLAFSIATRIYLWALVAMTGTALIIGGATWYVSDQQTRAHSQQEIQEALRGIQFELDRKDQGLKTIAHWLVARQDFAQFVASRDQKGLNNLLQLLVKASIVDSITVANSKGVVLVQVSEDQPPTEGGNVLARVGVDAALRRAYQRHGKAELGSSDEKSHFANL